jgi:hypothetical protein
MDNDGTVLRQAFKLRAKNDYQSFSLRTTSSAPGGLLSIFLGGEEQAGLSMYIPQRTDKCEKRGVCQLLASWYAICGTVDIL